MSVVKIVSHDESVYNLVEKKVPPPEKMKRYNSIYRDMVRQEKIVRLSSHKTFGPAVLPLFPPDEFLKKYSRLCLDEQNLKKPDHNHFEVRLKAPLPEKPGVIIHRNLNHKVENIKRVTSAPPKKPAPRFVDTKNGDFFHIEKSGLMPKYVLNEKFGKTPSYIRRKLSATNAKLKEDETESNVHIVSDNERNEILNGLRSNWDILQKEYQGLPVMTDTVPKMARKTKLENQLKQIEKDILLLEKNQMIVVV